MPLSVLPRRADMTITRFARVETLLKRRAIVRGSTYTQTFIVLDSAGAAYNLNNPSTPSWTARAQLRNEYDRLGGAIAVTFTCVVAAGAGGSVTITLVPLDTKTSTVTEGVWDMELENLADAGWPVGAKFTVFTGRWRMIDDVTVV